MLAEHKILFKFSNFILTRLKRETMTQRIHIFFKPSGFKFRINWKEIRIYEQEERHNRKARNKQANLKKLQPPEKFIYRHRNRTLQCLL
jgi:hypothetical protein